MKRILQEIPLARKQLILLFARLDQDEQVDIGGIGVCVCVCVCVVCVCVQSMQSIIKSSINCCSLASLLSFFFFKENPQIKNFLLDVFKLVKLKKDGDTYRRSLVTPILLEAFEDCFPSSSFSAPSNMAGSPTKRPRESAFTSTSSNQVIHGPSLPPPNYTEESAPTPIPTSVETTSQSTIAQPPSKRKAVGPSIPTVLSRNLCGRMN